MASTIFTHLPLALSAVGALAEDRPRMVHRSVAKRAIGDAQLFKHFDSMPWTFYDVGHGACGQTNVAADFIVALNAEQFGSGYPGPNCFKQITLNYNGKTATATIMDSCPGCPYGGLDLSRGLFQHFASKDVGVVYGSWSFNDGSPTTPTVNATVVSPTTSHTSTPAATTSSHAAADIQTSSRATTSTHRFGSTTTSTRAAANLAAVSISSHATRSSTPTSVLAYSASFAQVSSSSASLASSFSLLSAAESVTPSANPTDTAGLIQDNLAAINELLTRLAELVTTAGLGDEEAD